MRSIRRIISGGQTGADLAAWDVARELAIPFGGYVPAGRVNERGKIDDKYDNLQETASSEPNERTLKNVESADATLIICRGLPKGGTLKTKEHCDYVKKPCLVADITAGVTADVVRDIERWLHFHRPIVLNVAGPRESEDGNIYEDVRNALGESLRHSFMPREDLNELIRYVHTDFKADFRHWDQIRWLVPSWYVTLLAGAAVFLTQGGGKPHWSVPAVIGVFGILCNLLAFRTMKYHTIQVKRFLELCKEVEADDLLERELKHLPFDFHFPGVLKTATFWFHFFVFLTACCCIGLAIKLAFWP